MNCKKITSLALAALTIATVASFASCKDDQSSSLKVVEYTLTEEKYAYAVNEGNVAMKDAIDGYLDTIKENGTFDAIVSKYQSEETSSYVGIDVASQSASPDANDLVVLTNTPFGNFEFVGDDGKYYGIDMEIAAGFAQYQNKDLFIVEWAEFATILNQFNTYPDAIVMAGLSVDAERDLTVDFSKEYFSAGQAIIALSSDNMFDDCNSADDVKAKLSSLSGKKIGYQSGTTAGILLQEEEYAQITAQGFATAVLAAQALLNGSIDYVIVDQSPANSIVKQLNTLA